MDRQQTFRLFSCLVCLCHYEFTWQWHREELRIYDSIELAVTGGDVKECENQKNICVSDSNDCASVHPHRTDVFLNTTCRYFVHNESFGCKWIYLNDTKVKMINSFIFTQTPDFSHCPSIFYPLAEFNLTIMSKDPINKIEVFSEVYEISFETITQAPRPKITSVNATDTSLNVTWSGEWHSGMSVECQIRYKQSTMGQWTEVSKTDSEMFHVIRGLQPFSRYSLTVACSLGYGLQSDWSEEFEGMTSEAVPTAAPSVSYCVETLDPGLRTQKLLLLWKVSEARGVILGYNVTYASTSEPSPKTIITTDLKAELVVAEGVYNVTLMAYNSAGQSPVRHVRINTGLSESLPRVRQLWASAEGDSLRIWWENETAAASMDEFAIEWYSFGDAASKQWKRIDGTMFSTVLTDHIKQLENYSISVYPLFDSLCGPPASVQASLESGILLDIDQLRLVNMTKTFVTVQWMWQRKDPGTSVLRYRLALIGPHETTSLIVFPDQWQHTFYHLQMNVKYSVCIYGETGSGNLSKANIEFTTPLVENDQIVKVAVPILLLIVGFGIFSVLSRTIYKEYFFPNIANPGQSLIGHWLLNPLHETGKTVSVFKPEDVPLNTEKCLTQMEPQKSMEVEDVDEDMLLSELDLPDFCLLETSGSGERPQVSPGLTEYVDLPFLPDNFGYVENCHSPASVS